MGTSRTSYDTVILAVDVGGTNINAALVGRKGGTFTLLSERRYSTRAEPSLAEPLARFMAEAAAETRFLPELLCVSGAGPVDGRIIRMTNAPWNIDGAALEVEFSLRTFVINDFSAIAWGVLLLDPADPDELLQLEGADGSRPASAQNGTVVVIGAGTGLGFGYAVREPGGPRVHPSEGGHVTLPVYDDQSRAFSRWLEDRYGFCAGAEAAVSGQGIANLFEFHRSRMPAEAGSATVRRVLDAPEADRPALVAAAAAEGDPVCASAMTMFVRLYARVAADAAAVFLPTGGVYLAGGIAAKNEAWFTDGHRFMETFRMAYREHVRTILGHTPVFIVKDYAISLYGAAHAASVLAG